MDNVKDDRYYVAKIVTDLSFILDHTGGVTKEDITEDEVLLDSIMFRLIQVSESAERLSAEFKDNRPDIPWRAIRGLRNRIVHEYSHVDLGVIYNTVTIDLPELLKELEGII
jgi:uncharacterized protein with HEPN domain